MLKKLSLCHKINKFYRIFGEALDVVPCRTHIRDLSKEGFLDGVRYDVAEAIEAYADVFDEESYAMGVWLDKLNADIINLGVRPRHNYAVVIALALVVLALVGGYTIGRQHTIRQAALYDIAEDEYYLSFGDEVHTYTFEEE